MTSDAADESQSRLEAMAGQFQELARSMIDRDGELHIEAVLQYARSAVPGADHASISLERQGFELETICATGALPVEADALQYALHEGPCLAALEQSDLVWVDDLRTDAQFPAFAPRAVELGIGSMLSTRIFLSEQNRAGLNLYATAPSAFGPEQFPVAAIFASYASLLMLNKMHHDKVMRLERTLESNREIGVAMGILMARRRWSQAEAFDRLVQASQNLNRRLHDIAAEVNATRRLPRPGDRAGAQS